MRGEYKIHLMLTILMLIAISMITWVLIMLLAFIMGGEALVLFVEFKIWVILVSIVVGILAITAFIQLDIRYVHGEQKKLDNPYHHQAKWAVIGLMVSLACILIISFMIPKTTREFSQSIAVMHTFFLFGCSKEDDSQDLEE